MNRLVGALLVALALWCVGLTWIVVANPTEGLSSELQSGQPPVIAFVHGDSVQLGYAFIVEQREKLFSAVQEAQAALELESAPLQREAQELIEFGNSLPANADEIQMVQKRLGEIQSQVNQMQETGINRLADLEAVLTSDAAEKLTEEMMLFAVQNDIDVVLNWGESGEGVLFGSVEWDVTTPFLKFINDRFQAGEVNTVVSLETK